MNRREGFDRRSTRHCIRWFGLLLGLLPLAATAHYPWLEPETFAPEAGSALEFQVGWGHRFPQDGRLTGDRLSSALLVGPEGVSHSFVPPDGERFVTPPLADSGPHLLAVTQARSYYSRTPQGGRRASRAEYPDALTCSYSGNAMKAVLGQGTGEGVVDRVLGHALELVPMVNPAMLGAGDTLAVRVLLHGKPYHGPVSAVYAGFQGAEGEYPVSVDTDADGIARVPVDRPGDWLVRVQVREPFEDTRQCDHHSYSATLTFRMPG